MVSFGYSKYGTFIKPFELFLSTIQPGLPTICDSRPCDLELSYMMYILSPWTPVFHPTKCLSSSDKPSANA